MLNQVYSDFKNLCVEQLGEEGADIDLWIHRLRHLHPGSPGGGRGVRPNESDIDGADTGILCAKRGYAGTEEKLQSAPRKKTNKFMER